MIFVVEPAGAVQGALGFRIPKPTCCNLAQTDWLGQGRRQRLKLKAGKGVE
jgi:hypothetical protein